MTGPVKVGERNYPDLKRLMSRPVSEGLRCFVEDHIRWGKGGRDVWEPDWHWDDTKTEPGPVRHLSLVLSDDHGCEGDGAPDAA